MGEADRAARTLKGISVVSVWAEKGLPEEAGAGAAAPSRGRAREARVSFIMAKGGEKWRKWKWKWRIDGC